jgi:hypothetical protein
MADGLYVDPSAEMRRVHEGVTQNGYAVTNEWDIGLPEKCGWTLREEYFNSGRLRRDPGDFPADRERARDVVLYRWHDGQLILDEHESISIRDRSGIEGERIHKRIELLKDPQARKLIETFLCLVPEGRRKAKGTFGINLFRTHTDVVTKPHQDNEEFIILYVLDREGEGAESYLYDNDGQGPGVPDGAEPVFWRQLNPGDLMIFEDEKFKHGATPLAAPSSGRAKRDVLVCTVDYRTTYLECDGS